MCTLLCVVLAAAAAAALLGPAQANQQYNQLDQNYRVGVDIVLQQLQSFPGVQLHFHFFRTIDKSDFESGFGMSSIFHHFHLKPTRCAKGTSVAQSCPFRNDRPIMDCVVCYKVFQHVIETAPKPYIHCIQRPKLTPEMRATRLDHCRRMTYTSGAPTLLAVSGPT
ncbi:hypothetical protein N1851_017703 [Merluccius polli]|uniref:Retinoic acid receptor responder protein 2 n=1 Tax=Merluccius polli TaxID=89951 RepID=A0AA47MPA1_MERPO|nr:hypothetical protein N1851_017703 [Merluccius polli]